MRVHPMAGALLRAIVVLIIALLTMRAPQGVEETNECRDASDYFGGAVFVVGLRRARRALHAAILAPIAAIKAMRATHPLLRPTRGVLLHGPPGTGKTLLGRWVAMRLDGAFVAVTPDSVQCRWYGETPRRVRELFRTARARAPCVLFFDEIDGMLRSRSSGEMGVEREFKTTMLSEMSRAEDDDGPIVVLMGATNRPDDVDAAVLRRLPLHVHVPLPGARARTRMLGRHLLWSESGASPSARAGLEWFAGVSEGLACSDIHEVARAAVRLAHERRACGGVSVDERDVRDATRTVSVRSATSVRSSVAECRWK
jgi:SpoVK/Ycf46/Vps4 family AAA+-type ATPase